MLEARLSEKAAVEGASESNPIDGRWLVSEYYQSVYRYAFRLSGSQVDAEDLVQQTYLVAQTKLTQLRDRTKVQAWLFAVLRSCFLKSRRRPRPAPAAALELDVEEVAEHRMEAGKLDQEELQVALQELPDEFRLVVLMFYFEELSYKEIADRLQLPIGTVMSRLSRAKGRLRQALFDPEPDDGGKLRRNVAAPHP